MTRGGLVDAGSGQSPLAGGSIPLPLGQFQQPGRDRPDVVMFGVNALSGHFRRENRETHLQAKQFLHLFNRWPGAS